MQQHAPSSGAERPILSERRLRAAEVRQVTSITPHMRRVTLASTELVDFPAHHPAQWVKLFVPTPGSGKPSGRAYTIRHFRAEPCEMDIDVVLHGCGPCSTWAENAVPGARVQIAGPRAGFRLDPEVSHLLIGGDETALPAIGAILEALPAGLSVAVLVEVPTDEDAQILHSQAEVAITWLARDGQAAGTATTLGAAMMRAALPQDSGQVWFAAEAAVARAVRRHFQLDRALPRDRLVVSGYWKKGETDFRDREGNQ